MSGSQAASSFPINLDGNAAEKSREFGNELEKLRQRIEGGSSSLKGLEASMKRLQSASIVDVAAARSLKDRIQEQKDTIAAASTQVLKLGTTYEQLASKAKSVGKEHENLSKNTKTLDNAVRGASPRMAELSDKLSGFMDVVAGGGGLELAAAGIAAIGVALIAAGVAAVAFGAAMAVTLAQFVVESQNAARSANLLRLAFAGTDTNARNLGTQVDALASKVSTSKVELNKLASELAEAGFQGQTLVDTFNAIGGASGAGADKAAAKIREVLDRSKLSGRVGINPMELLGSGLKFDEIATSLADQMGVGVARARSALLQGAVPLGDAAAAMRKAIETKFGAINAAKMLDLGTQVEKFKENLAGLSKDVNIEPMLQDFSQLFGLFSSSSSVTGGALKQLVTAFGSGFVDAVHESTPVAKAFIEGLVLGALKLYGKWLDLRIAVRDAFANSETLQRMKGFADKVDLVSFAGKLGIFVFGALAGAFLVVASSLAVCLAPFAALAVSLYFVAKGAAMAATAFLSVGKTIIDGLMSPLKSLETMVPEAISTLLATLVKSGHPAFLAGQLIGQQLKDGILNPLHGAAGGGDLHQASGGFVSDLVNSLKKKADIHSPSGLTRREVGQPMGEGVVIGAVEGLGAGVPNVARALDSMMPSGPSKSGKAGGAAANDNASANARPIEIHFHLATKEAAEAVKQPDIYAQFLRMVEEALKSQGIPVRT